MNNTICITTLSNNNRIELIHTILSFLNNTILSNTILSNTILSNTILSNTILDNTILSNTINWYILIQGYSTEYLDNITHIVDRIKENYSINIILLLETKNLGLSKGFNILVEKTRNYKYVLHIEDDWISIPNINKYWLLDSMLLMEQNSTISTILLRKYLDDTEKSKYGWNTHLNYINFKYQNNFNYQSKMKNSISINSNNTFFKKIPNCLFTLNPHIRRNIDYFTNDVIPLIELDDIDIENRHPGNWGYSEANSMEKTYHLNSYYLLDGIFSHYDDWFQSWKPDDLNQYLYQNNCAILNLVVQVLFY